MQTTILVLHILVCVVLIILVLLQAGREGMGVIFGGGGNSSVFGSQGAGGILSKLTAFLAVLFIVTSLGYNIMFSSNSDANKSVLDVQFESGTTQTPPVVPTAPVETSSSTTPEPEKTAPAVEPVNTETVNTPENTEAQQTPAEIVSPTMENSETTAPTATEAQ